MQRDVETRLGWSPFVPDNRPSETIEALVTRESNTWRANIQLRDADGASLGSRDVTSPAQTCDSLAATAALAIALIIEPVLPAAPAVPTPPPTKPPPPPEAPKPAPRTTNDEPASAQARANVRAVHGGVALGAIAAENVLPQLAVGPTLRAEVQLVDRLFARATANFFPEQHARGASGDVAFGLTVGSLGACYRLPLTSAWRAEGCASALLGSLDVTVHSPTPIAPGARTWWAGSLGLASAWRLGQAEISVEIAALDHFARHTYLIDQTDPGSSGSVFVEPAFGALGTLGAGVQF